MLPPYHASDAAFERVLSNQFAHSDFLSRLFFFSNCKPLQSQMQTSRAESGVVFAVTNIPTIA